MESIILSKSFFKPRIQNKSHYISKNSVRNNKNTKSRINHINKILLIILYLYARLQQTNSYIINIKIKGIGKQQIISSNTDGFNSIPDEIYVNDVLQNYKDIYVYDLQDEINFITIKYNSETNFEICHKMFYNLLNVLTIDFIDFYTPNLRDTRNMFEGCENLSSLSLNNMDTSSVLDMSEMFKNCKKLIHINLKNFDVSKVTSMWRMFHNCNSLTYLNINLNTKSDLYAYTMFDGCDRTNLKVCLDSVKANRIVIAYPSLNINCDAVCYYNNIYFCNDNNDICPTEYKNIIKEKSLCINNCQFDEYYNYEYNNRCIHKCPKRTKIDENNAFLCQDLNCINFYNYEQNGCIDSIPEGYFLNNSKEKTIDLCDSNCKTCEEISTKCLSCIEYYYVNLNNYRCEQCQNHCKKCDSYENCLLCDENYILLSNDNINNKCYEKCLYYYYFDELGNYLCTTSEECPQSFNKLINNKNKCIDQCFNDNIYKKEYENICYEECPLYTINKNNICELDFNELLKNETNDYKMKYIQNFIKNNDAEKILQKIDEENKIILKFDEMIIYLMNLSNPENNDNNNSQNETIIQLNECENILKDAYNISENDSLILYKVDILKSRMRIPRIEYEIYFPLNGSKLEVLNLSKCSNITIDIILPMKIKEEDIDKRNIKSDYYKDICYKAKSEFNTDINMEDRKNYYLDNNLNICEEKCEFYKYEKDKEKVRCSCEIKTKFKLFSEVNINKTELVKGFQKVYNKMNIKIIKCYHLLLNFSENIKNYAFYIFVPIFICHFIFIFIYCFKEKNKLKIIINKITFNKLKNNINKNNINKNNIRKNKKNFNYYIKKKEIINNNINQYNFNINNNNKNIKDKNIKTKSKENNMKSNNKGQIKLNNFNNSNQIKRIKGKPKFKKQMNNLKRKNILKSNKNINKSMNYASNSKNRLNKNLSDNKKNSNIFKKILKKNSNNFTINELNQLPYEEALKYDQRSYSEYYFSLLKVKNLVFFSFFLNNDYNSKIVKIDLFICLFIVFLTVNALFFNDKTMHKIYTDQGSFNIISQISQIIFSALISSFINFIIQFFALTEKNFIDLKIIKDEQIIKRSTKIIFCKINAFFIISFLFLIIFGYYLSCFCAVYENTQLHLIKDTVISFGLQMIYPLFINLIPGIFRRCALKGKNKILYKISKLLQIF